MADQLHFTKTAFITEVLGRVLLYAQCTQNPDIAWWWPIVTIPISWQIWDGFLFSGFQRIGSRGLRLIADALSYLVYLWYIVFTIRAMGSNIGQWYGWILGVVVAVVVAQFFGLLWPSRWHREHLDSRYA